MTSENTDRTFRKASLQKALQNKPGLNIGALATGGALALLSSSIPLNLWLSVSAVAAVGLIGASILGGRHHE